MTANNLLQASAFGTRVRIRREHLGMSRADLAVSLNMSRQQVTNIEAGRAWPTIVMLLKLCDVMSVDPGPWLRAPDCDACGDMPPPGFACLDCGAKGERPADT